MTRAAEAKVESLGQRVVSDLTRFLNVEANAISAGKVAGILGINHMLSYSVKYWAENELNAMRDIMRDEAELDHIPTILEAYRWQREREAAYHAKSKASTGNGEPVPASKPGSQ